MLPQHLKQIRVLMLNDKDNLERTLFRLEQGKASVYSVVIYYIIVVLNDQKSNIDEHLLDRSHVLTF